MRQGDIEQGGAGDPIAALGDRIADLSRRMDTGFNRVDADLKEQARETRAGFQRVDAEIKEQAKEMKIGFDRMQRLMTQGAIGMSSTFVVGFATLAALS